MPDDLALAKTLGILAYGQQQYDTSIFSLQRCAEKSGKDGEVDYFLGMDYYKLKRRNDSKLALKRALDLGLAENLASQAQATIRELK